MSKVTTFICDKCRVSLADTEYYSVVVFDADGDPLLQGEGLDLCGLDLCPSCYRAWKVSMRTWLTMPEPRATRGIRIRN